MNKDGQADIGLGVIMITFIAIVVGVILFQTIAQEVGSSTNTVTVNSSETLALNGASIYIEEYQSLSSVVIVNASNQSQTVPSTNYTVTNNGLNPTTNALAVKITTADGDWNSSAVYVQGTGEPLTYISSGAGRSIALLIPIMFALAIVVIALTPTLRQGLLEKLGK